MALRQLLTSRVSLRASSLSLGRRGTKNLDWYFNAIEAGEAAKTKVQAPVFPAETLHGKKRARAFMDFQFGKDQPDTPAPVSRVVFELADDIVPMTVKNFLALCDRPAGQGYKSSEIFQVRKGFGITAGDWVSKNGQGGHSSFGSHKYFVDENFIGRHSAAGVLSMANAGVHTNSSIFFITLAPQPQLDGRNVAFGRVLLGMDTVSKIGGVFTVNFMPASPIFIKDAGALPESEWPAVDKAVAAAEAAAAKAAKPAAAGDKKAAAAK